MTTARRLVLLELWDSEREEAPLGSKMRELGEMYSLIL